jgi:hypothetical protein
MCHHYDVPWTERTVEEATDAPDEEDEEAETPAFLVEERATDVDLLTDGGDEE